MAKQEEAQKFERVKVYEIVKEKEFNPDPKAMKIGTKWDVTNKGTKKNKHVIKARLVGMEFADDTRKRSCLQEGEGSLRCALVSTLAKKNNVNVWR